MQLAQAIYDLIYDSLTMAPAGSQPATSADSTTLSLALPGLPLDPAEFTNPWTPMNAGGDPVAAENFASLVDAVQEVSAPYISNGNSVETLYGQIVQANTLTPSAATTATPSQPPPRSSAPAPLAGPSRMRAMGSPRVERAPVGGRKLVVEAPALRDVVSVNRRVLESLSPKVRGAFERLYTEGTLLTPRGEPIKTFVETPAFRSYLDRRAARDEAVTRYMTQLLQVDMNDASDKARWASAAPALEAQVKLTTKAVEEVDAGEVEKAMSTVNDGEGQNNSVAEIFAAARLNFELSKLGSMMGPGYTWHMTLAKPQNWFAPEATFFDVDLTTTRALRVNRASRFPQLGRPADLGAGLWQYRAQNNLLRRPVAQDSLNIRVRFKFARVNIYRPWLNASLFSLGNWSMAGRRRNELSTGSLKGNTGIFPLLPTSIIVARDLQISGTWSHTEVTFIRERLEQTDLAFGPFALSGQFKRPRAKSSKVVNAAFDGVTITAPGLQAIGCISKLMPACPPLDG